MFSFRSLNILPFVESLTIEQQRAIRTIEVQTCAADGLFKNKAEIETEKTDLVKELKLLTVLKKVVMVNMPVRGKGSIWHDIWAERQKHSVMETKKDLKHWLGEKIS
jgi:hypothetical protein